MRPSVGTRTDERMPPAYLDFTESVCAAFDRRPRRREKVAAILAPGLVPRMEGDLNPLQRLGQAGEVASQDVQHRRLLDPLSGDQT